MIRIKQGNVLAIQNNNKYYYVIVITRIIMFGGNLVYAFHLETDKLLKLNELLAQKISGFVSIVDFIWAKRENRLLKIGEVQNADKYWKYKFFKGTFTLEGKASTWSIYNNELKLVKRTSTLTEDEKKYPQYSRIDDVLLVDLIKQRWMPEKDERI